MKKIWLGIGALALSFSALSADFKEGVEYRVLKDQPRVENSIVKVFSVYCPFCYKYEKSVTPMLAKTYGDKFDAYHLTEKGDFGKVATPVLAALKTIGPEPYKAAKMAYYGAIFDKKMTFKDETAFRQYGLDAAKVSQADFEAALAKPQTQATIKLWQDKALPVAKVQGVPAIVVNGQYLVNTSKVTSMDMLKGLIDHLLAKK
ncbi:MAG: thiol:disulfide interchange protein DsbA/DsbL [Burkholderiaceae bacterium]